MSFVCELYLNLTRRRETYNQMKNQLNECLTKEEPKYSISPSIQQFYKIEKIELFGIDTFYYQGDKTRCILYLHGGCYMNQPLIFHWNFLSKIHQRTNSTIFVPIYPKAPHHHYEESYKIIPQLYAKLRNEYKSVIVMGDSSGGGLSLGLCQFFINENIQQPNELILIAPWLDLSFSNPEIEAAEKRDPRNKRSRLSAIAESWSRGDLLNYMVSPIFGSFKGLKNVTVIVGTNDILYPDCAKLEKMLDAENVKNKFIVAEKMNHVYPVYPIPEAKSAINEICSIVSSSC